MKTSTDSISKLKCDNGWKEATRRIEYTLRKPTPYLGARDDAGKGSV